MGCSASVMGTGGVSLPVRQANKQYNAPEPLIMKALIMQQQGDVEGAAATLGEAIRRWPNCARAYAERGRMLMELHQLDLALSDFGSAIKLQPDFSMALVLRCQALVDLGRLEEASSDYARAHKLDPENGQLRTIKAAIRTKRQQRDEARAAGLMAAGRPPGGSLGPGLLASFRNSMTKLQVGEQDGASSERPSGSGADRLAATESRGGSESAALSSRHQRQLSDEDPFAGLDTPMSTRDFKKACMICMDKDRGCRLRPCLHAALCVECAQGLKARHYGCPICNTQIESLEVGSFAKTYSVEEAAALVAYASTIKSPLALPQLREEVNEGSDPPPSTSPPRVAPAGTAPGVAGGRQEVDQEAEAQEVPDPEDLRASVESLPAQAGLSVGSSRNLDVSLDAIGGLPDATASSGGGGQPSIPE